MTGTITEQAQQVLSLGLGFLDALEVLVWLRVAVYIVLLLFTVRVALGIVMGRS